MDRIGIVNPGVTVPPPLHDNDTRARAFREFHGLGDGPCLLSIGRMTARKGLREFVSGVLPRITARHPEVRLVVVGAIGRASVGKECVSTCRTRWSPEH